MNWTNGSTTLYQADARAIPLPDASVHMVVTSPPYWGLRDYGLEAGIGLEPTLGEWVQNIVAVMREVKRVLRDDGTCWLNLGDAYAGSWGNYGSREGKQRSRISERWHRPAYENAENGYRDKPPGAEMPDLAPKNLMGQPWRVAFALQDDGWILRSAITWHQTRCRSLCGTGPPAHTR